MNQKDIERLAALHDEVSVLRYTPEAYRKFAKDMDDPKAKLSFGLHAAGTIHVPIAEFRDLIAPVLMRLADESEAKLAELESPWDNPLRPSLRPKLPR